MAGIFYHVHPPASECACKCGYTCQGPGLCPLFKEDFLKCIEQHWAGNCTHVFDKMKDFGSYSSLVCKCGLSALSHDARCGP